MYGVYTWGKTPSVGFKGSIVGGASSCVVSVVGLVDTTAFWNTGSSDSSTSLHEISFLWEN